MHCTLSNNVHDLFRASLLTNDLLRSHIGVDRGVIFDVYVEKLSNFYELNGIVLNFVSIGSCDGKSDSSVRFYMNNSHWKGLFVESVFQNVQDLRKLRLSTDKTCAPLLLYFRLTLGFLHVGSGPTSSRLGEILYGKSPQWEAWRWSCRRDTHHGTCGGTTV